MSQKSKLNRARREAKQEEEGNTPGMLITTGTSLNIFTLDKTIENLWNETVEKYYI